MGTRTAFSYLIRPSSIYYFRVIVPPDLRGVVGKKEIRYSLRTGFLSEAKYRALRMASFVQRLFREIRKGGIMSELSKAEIQKLIQAYMREVLEDYEVFLAREKPVGLERASDHLEALSFLQSDLKEALFRRDYRSAEHAVDILLEEKSIELNKDSDSYKMLCREMLKAQIDGLDLQAKLERGESIEKGI